MKTRRENSAMAEGGRNARPLTVFGRIALSFIVAALLLFALMLTPPVKPPVMFGQSQIESDDVRQIDWDSLPETVVAWVEVPGTSIDEPIAQAETNWPSRYLYEDALGQGAYGTPYIDCDCAADSPFVVVYGHHMSNGSVFADFASFIDRSYAEDHATIYIYTRYDNSRHVLKVKAVDVVNAYSELIRTDFVSDEDRIAYLNQNLSKCDLLIQDEEISDEDV